MLVPKFKDLLWKYKIVIPTPKKNNQKSALDSISFYPRTDHGDSGGPLLYFNNSWSLVGVTAWKINVSDRFPLPGYYNGFVSVKVALPWIEDTLREGGDFNCRPQGYH